MFWPLRFGLFLVALASPVVNWRIGLVIGFALLVDFVTYLWMTLPLFSIIGELVLLCGTGAVVGTVIVLGYRRLSWWIAPVVAMVILTALRGALYVSGLVNNVLTVDDVIRGLPGSVALVLGAPGALVVPALVVRLTASRRRAQNIKKQTLTPTSAPNGDGQNSELY